MKISECMTRDVRIVDPDETLEHAAQEMARIDAGVLPVGDGDRLVGFVTDRDIAIRGVGRRCPPDAHVRDVMSGEVLYCYSDDDSEDVLDNMGDIQVRRLPVVDQDKRLVGIVSISDLTNGGEAERAGRALRDIARPSVQHSQRA